MPEDPATEYARAIDKCVDRSMIGQVTLRKKYLRLPHNAVRTLTFAAVRRNALELDQGVPPGVSAFIDFVDQQPKISIPDKDYFHARA